MIHDMKQSRSVARIRDGRLAETGPRRLDAGYPHAAATCVADDEKQLGRAQAVAGRVINDFLDRGWIRSAPDGRVEISEPGRATHEAAMQRVTETRQALRRGITDDEYVSVIRILQRMTSNLETI